MEGPPRAMRVLMGIGILAFAVVACLSFCMAAVSPESEVVLHYVTPDEYARIRTVSLVVGTLAVLLDAVLFYILFRRRSAGAEAQR